MKDKKSLINSHIFLYMTEFFSGMAVMAVELGASRLLAPYFSSSQIVWTIIIGTIMIAMALGNIYGGKKADENPDPDRLYSRVLVAAVWIAAIPFAGRFIIILIAGLLAVTVRTGFLVWAAFLSCMIIFVYPLFLLGTVTPSLVKYTTDSLENNAEVVGRLGAMNTIGSIIGTFLPTFVTIPAVGTAVTFILFSGILLALAIFYFFSKKAGLRKSLLALVLFIIFTILGSTGRFAFWEKNLTYEGESVYNYLQVKDLSDRTILSTNVLFGVQSVKMKTDDLTGMYYDYALAAPVMADFQDKEHPSLLVLGMGTGTFAKQTEKSFPGTDVTGVEIDEKITGLAHTYFDLPEDIPVVTYDGRAFLSGTDEKYDCIMVDAYQDITIPFQMSSKEFFTEVRDHLKPGGVMVVNLNMHSDKAGSINAGLTDTIASVFPNVETVDVKGNTNRELFASVNTDLAAALSENAGGIGDRQLSAMMETVSEGLETPETGGTVFTDDKAPVELLGMRMIDDLISDELAYYKKVLKEEGIQGILNEM